MIGQRQTGTTSLDTTSRPAQCAVLLSGTPPRLHASVLSTTRRRRRTKTVTAPGTRATRTARREAPCCAGMIRGRPRHRRERREERRQGRRDVENVEAAMPVWSPGPGRLTPRDD
jgi:hypothetical protein